MAPNATVIKLVLGETDPMLWNALRFSLVAMACLPFLLANWHKMFNKKLRAWTILAALSMTIAVTSFTMALKYSPASYVAILSLAMPIGTILLSTALTNDKITKRALVGIVFAATGAIVIVLLPILIDQTSEVKFYPLATLLMVVDVVFLNLAIVLMRKTNEKRVPLPASIGLSAIMISAVSSIIFFLIDGNSPTLPTNPYFWIAAAYSGLGVAFVGRLIYILIFEKKGGAFMGSISYFQTFLSILIPIIVLGEKLSIWTIAGGILVITGVYISEHHKHKHAKHHMTWQNHR